MNFLGCNLSRNELISGIHRQLVVTLTLREKCPNTELFLTRILPHSDWIRRDTSYLSVFSPNAGKYGPEITPHLDTFQAVNILRKISLQFQNLKLSISCKIAFYIFFVIKCETFEVKRSIRQFWSNQNSLNKTVCFHCTKNKVFH